MLDRSEGQSCQANNFLRVFRTLREASVLGLLLNWGNEEQKTNLGKLIQSWTCFVLQQLHQETDPKSLNISLMATPSTPSYKNLNTPTTPLIPLGMSSFLDPEDRVEGSAGGDGGNGNARCGEEEVSIIQKVFGSSVETLVKCRCGWSTVTQRIELLFSLCYPHSPGTACMYIVYCMYIP